jgi:hypothetical protein
VGGILHVVVVMNQESPTLWDCTVEVTLPHFGIGALGTGVERLRLDVLACLHRPVLVMTPFRGLMQSHPSSVVAASEDISIGKSSLELR